MPAAAVVFVTDYGVDDTYAGALVGACWRVDPGLRCVAATHGVPPGDRLAGAYHCAAAARDFPVGTVLCAVVDPGVGTGRRAIAVEAGPARCVAPDNGLVSYLWADAPAAERRCVALATPPGIAATFHGRDLFAPAAARLAAGADLAALGDLLEEPVLLPEAFARPEAGAVIGRVAVVDHFGNAITTVRGRDLRGGGLAGARWGGGGTDRVVRTYADIGGGLAALLNSSGHVEIAAAGRPAAALGGPGPGADVRVLVRPSGGAQGRVGQPVAR